MTVVFDELVEKAAAAIEITFQFLGYPDTRMPGTESVDCVEVARVALEVMVPEIRRLERENDALRQRYAMDVRGNGE